jgi:hypothetical protein
MMLNYTLLNERNGDAFDMAFKSEQKLQQYLDANENIKIVGSSKAYLPTRHIRMKSEQQIAE